jgi:hypothetical protein
MRSIVHLSILVVLQLVAMDNEDFHPHIMTTFRRSNDVINVLNERLCHLENQRNNIEKSTTQILKETDHQLKTLKNNENRSVDEWIKLIKNMGKLELLVDCSVIPRENAQNIETRLKKTEEIAKEFLKVKKPRKKGFGSWLPSLIHLS